MAVARLHGVPLAGVVLEPTPPLRDVRGSAGRAQSIVRVDRPKAALRLEVEGLGIVGELGHWSRGGARRRDWRRFNQPFGIPEWHDSRAEARSRPGGRTSVLPNAALQLSIRASSLRLQLFNPADQILKYFGNGYQPDGKNVDHFGIEDECLGIRSRSASADHLVDSLLGGVCGSSQLGYVFFLKHGFQALSRNAGIWQTVRRQPSEAKLPLGPRPASKPLAMSGIGPIPLLGGGPD